MYHQVLCIETSRTNYYKSLLHGVHWPIPCFQWSSLSTSVLLSYSGIYLRLLLPSWDRWSSAGLTFVSASSSCDMKQQWGTSVAQCSEGMVGNTLVTWINMRNNQLCSGTVSGRTQEHLTEWRNSLSPYQAPCVLDTRPHLVFVEWFVNRLKK